MTPEEFTSRLPALSNDSLPIKPPFEFTGLSARIFPLRANLDVLQQLCNGYLNIVPPEIGRFRAVVPYAYLAMLDYGQIAEQVTPLGWFAQLEVFFCVPVEWYRVVNGRWVFHDWAVFTPYIYVSDDFSVPMGRMVYGFPKTLAQVTPPASRWLRDSAAPVTLARVETAVFPKLYEGRRLETRVFLEIERAAPMSNFRIPADPRSPIAPWVVASNFAEAMAGFSRDAMWLSQSMRIFEPHPGTGPAFGPAMFERIAPGFAPGGTGYILNSLNLKQFRHSDDPSRICYQSLTNGRMQTKAFNGGGLLGEENTVLGDLSGGYTIKLHEYSSLPIARTLGLEVHRRWQGDGVDVASFKPVMPFWLDVNVLYQQGVNLAWRTSNGIWHNGSGEPLDPSKKPVSAAKSPEFNSMGSAVDAVAGPFQFTGTTIRVLPLLAHRKALETFLDKAINSALVAPGAAPGGAKQPQVKLSLWARPPAPDEKDGPPVGGQYGYVYMTVSSFGGVTSKTNNVGDWAKYELSFLIPVKRERLDENGDWQVESVGVVPAHTFVDDTTAAISRSEVLGIPTSCAKFVLPESVWLRGGEDELGSKQTVLRVDAEVVPAIGAGQQTAMHTVVEVSARDVEIGEPASLAARAEWAKTLRLELGTKKGTRAKFPRECRIARALALELLGNQAPVSLYTLKQIRDVADPGKACYQSLVRVPRVFDEVFDVREIEETIRVRIHEFPTLKLVEDLGIVADTIQEEGTGIAYGAQAIRPFYIRATIDEELGEQLLSRAGTLEWDLPDHLPESPLDGEGETIEADIKAGRTQDEGDPCRMSSVMYESVQRRRMDGKNKPTEREFSRRYQERLRGLTLRSRSIPDTPTREPEGQKGLQEAQREQEALRKAFTQRQARLVEQGMSTKDAENARLTEEERQKLRELRESLARNKWSREEAEQKENDLKILEKMNVILEAREEWRFRQRITKTAAREAFKVVDPQMVIESVLSREWGNVDEKARWRQGRVDLTKALDFMLRGGATPFAGFHLPTAVSEKAIEEAIRQGRLDFAEVEAALFESVRKDKVNRPGRPRMGPEVDEMIERMREFTILRLEMELHFDVLTAWSVSRSSSISLPLVTEAKLEQVTERLVEVMKEIAQKEVIGEPSKDGNLDIQVLADSTRLNELLRVFAAVKTRAQNKVPSAAMDQRASQKPDVDREATVAAQSTDPLTSEAYRGYRYMQEMTKALRTQADWLLDDQTTDAAQFVDLFRDAVQLARNYCDVQRDALLNKLSRAYQKPDFCVRRDAVGTACDTLLPITLSWDRDWYHGMTFSENEDQDQRERDGGAVTS